MSELNVYREQFGIRLTPPTVYQRLQMVFVQGCTFVSLTSFELKHLTSQERLVLDLPQVDHCHVAFVLKLKSRELKSRDEQPEKIRPPLRRNSLFHGGSCARA